MSNLIIRSKSASYRFWHGYWPIRHQTTNTLKMKKKLKISTLIIGIIVAVVALSSKNSYADNLEKSEATEVQNLDTEIMEVIEHIFDTEIATPDQEKCIKFYNTDHQLVYECRDKDDERLTILLRRSDLMLQTDSSSYYLLGD